MSESQSTKRVVTVFSLASFLHDVGSDIVFSVWPFFVTGVLGADMTILGFIDGLGDAVVSLSQAISGYISDRIRRRKVFVWLGYLFGGAARIGYALSPSWQFLIPFRILDRSGKMRGSPRDAIISDVSTRENRGKHFGILRAMDNAGAVVGILISIAFIGTLGFRTLFLFAAIPSVIAVLLVFFLIREKTTHEIHIFKGIRLSDLDANLRLYFVLNGIFALGAFSYSFLLIYARNYGFSIGQVPVLYLLFTVIAAIFSVPFGRLADRVGRKNVLFLSFLFWGAVPILLLLSHTYLSVVLAFIFFGLYNAALDPSQKTLTAELAPKNYIASTLGGFSLVTGIVNLPSSLIAGLLWDRVNMMVPLYVSLGLTALALCLLLFVKER